MKGGKNMNFSMVIENTLAAFQAQNPHISEGCDCQTLKAKYT